MFDWNILCCQWYVLSIGILSDRNRKVLDVAVTFPCRRRIGFVFPFNLPKNFLNIDPYHRTANITLCRSYLSDSTRLAERTRAVSMVSLAQVLGFIVGPALQAVVTPLGETGFSHLPGLNMYTAAGWLNVLMAIGNFCLFLPIFFKVRFDLTRWHFSF